ncbi:formylglycine-generating enzyme family protein [Methylomonas sp. MED-D]|uniref:formylglycine-generating enzyme family protein n=1 Tax=unclassified Methylomonas TaxID=2608980 RepID=UPI0028A37D25|nr:formylglycine-generating enzyme family protein [Methylomonas sp. MV1]MDT4328598.1 formylglycine-generating enzyme family protein [Methylomonas sp. MV1]
MRIDIANQSALGRADLLQMLADHRHADDERLMALAEVLGFEFSPKSVNVDPGVGTLTGTGFESHLISDGGAARLPRGLFRPMHAQRLELVASSEYWQKPAAATDYGVLSDADQAPWNADATAPPFQPLVPWTRLWPRLHQTVSRRHSAGLDVASLTRQLAQAKPVSRLPRQIRQCWPAKLHLILDFSDRLTPYWDDWRWLAGHLQPLLRERLSVSLLYRSDAERLHVWPASGGTQTRPWPSADSGETLLIASDLGMLDAIRPSARHHWQRRLQGLRRQDIACLIAAPLAHGQLVAETANLMPLLRLGPDNSLRPIAKLSPQHQAGAQDDTDPAYRLLLIWLAMATRAEPALLRALRLSLPTQADNAGLEGAVWLDARLNTAATACAVNEIAAAELQRQFSGLEPALQQRLLACLRDYHAGLPQMIHHEETLMWCGLVNAESAVPETEHAQNARRFFRKLTQSLQTPDGDQYQPAERHLLLNIADHHLQHAAASLAGEDYLNHLSVAVSRHRLLDRRPLPAGLNGADWLQRQPPIAPLTVDLLWRHDGTLAMVDRRPHAPAEPGRQRLLTLKLDRPVVLWSLQSAGHTRHYRPWYWLQQPLLADPLLQAAATPFSRESDQQLWLHTGRREIAIQPFVAPAWASEWGVDGYGLYADLQFNTVTQRFRWIEPGSLLMGSPASEPERYDDETQHLVTLSQGYWLADTACTQQFWQAVMGENPSHFNDDPVKPVETVSWHDVQTFIERLNRQIGGLRARLPSEAEWEYACRAGSETPFNFGDNISPRQVNYDSSRPYHNGEKGEYRQTTVAVKSLPANAWGLYEMHGNVWEWCRDAWREDLGSDDVTDPLFDPTDRGVVRVLRGGSWDFNGRLVRSAIRFRFQPGSRIISIGFRLALG